jgi:hypothetical protein
MLNVVVKRPAATFLTRYGSSKWSIRLLPLSVEEHISKRVSSFSVHHRRQPLSFWKKQESVKGLEIRREGVRRRAFIDTTLARYWHRSLHGRFEM